MHCAVYDRVADIVAKIEGANKENIDTWYFGNCINLDDIAVSALQFSVLGYTEFREW